MGKRIVIIGAGLAGLSTGIFAQANNYETLVVEQHRVAGGLAACWRRGDYLIDDGVHFLMGHKPGSSMYELYKQLEALEGLAVLDMRTYGRMTDEATGRTLDITDDLERLRKDMLAMFPRDATLVEDFIGRARGIGGARGLMDMGFGEPMELMGAMAKLRMYWSMRKDLKFLRGAYARPMAEYASGAKDPVLRDLLLSLFSPDSPLWFVLLVLVLLTQGELGLLQDGCRGLVANLVREYERLGGRIEYQARVESVIVEDNRAAGVRLKDGTERRGDVVISAADGRSTIYGLLGGKYLDKVIEARYSSWKVSQGYVTASYGVAMDLTGSPHMGYLRLDRPILVEGTERRMLSYRLLNYGTGFAPPGRCVVQAFYEGDFDYWERLRSDKNAYLSEKQRLGRETALLLDRVFPGLSGKVEVMDVATPYTTFRYTSNWKGSIMGWMATTEQISQTMNRTLPGLQGFYMVGQWAQPGGGVPGCLGQGRQIVQILCHEDRKTFHPPAR